MASIALLRRRPQATQPQTVRPIAWANRITRGLRFCYLPGLQVDLTRPSVPGVFVAPVTPVGGSIYVPGSSTVGGLQISTSAALLGPLANSTIAAVFQTTYGAPSAGSSAIYCERNSAGVDIYKLALASRNFAQYEAEFTYRIDSSGALLQQYVRDDSVINGEHHFAGAVKNGTAHTTYSNSLSATGTFGTSSTAFTDANINRTIGYDVADTNAAFHGAIHIVFGWERSLAPDEMESLRRDPYQLFLPSPRFSFAPSIVPGWISDLTTAGWTSTNGDLQSAIDETVASDADYITSPILQGAVSSGINAALVGTRTATVTATVTTGAGTSVGGSGNHGLMFVSFDPSTTISTITDSKSNTWSLLGTVKQAGPTRCKVAIYYALNWAGGASHTGTMTFSGTAYPVLHMIEVTGALSSSPFDIDVNLNYFAMPATLATGTLAQANEVIIGVLEENLNSSSSTEYLSSTMTMLSSEANDGLYWTSGVAKIVVSSTATTSQSMSKDTGISCDAVYRLISVKAAPASAGTAPAIFTLATPLAAGTYSEQIKAKVTANGRVRVTYLDAGGASVGSSAWTALTTTLAVYSLTITASATATKLQIEVDNT